MRKYTPLLLLSALFAIHACTKDKIEVPGAKDGTASVPAFDCDTIPVTYAVNIRPIVDNACALIGCHISGFSNGDFTGYSGLKEKADNGKLQTMVEGRIMPPATSIGPTSLTENEIRLILCWIQDGAPEN